MNFKHLFWMGINIKKSQKRAEESGPRGKHALPRNSMADIFIFVVRYYSALFTGTIKPLKVPKCEIFDRSDFPDFYTIKSRREGDFGVKIKKL